jgi:putative flippase GtrA
VTFSVNKYWAFDARRVGHLGHQSVKAVVVFLGSLGLNTALPSLCFYKLHIPSVAAFLVSQALVYVGWNYPLQRFWVFRR